MIAGGILGRFFVYFLGRWEGWERVVIFSSLLLASIYLKGNGENGIGWKEGKEGMEGTGEKGEGGKKGKGRRERGRKGRKTGLGIEHSLWVVSISLIWNERSGFRDSEF